MARRNPNTKQNSLHDAGSFLYLQYSHEWLCVRRHSYFWLSSRTVENGYASVKSFSTMEHAVKPFSAMRSRDA
jgi:hypothetical protein